MQEVQRDHFEANFHPDLSDLGYGAVYKKRTAEKNDGCAIFYKTEKFTLADWTSVEYYQPHIDVLNREKLLQDHYLMLMGKKIMNRSKMSQKDT